MVAFFSPFADKFNNNDEEESSSGDNPLLTRVRAVYRRRIILPTISQTR